MKPPANPQPLPMRWYAWAFWTVLAVGFLASVAVFRASREVELERAESEFVQRATVRHALTREVLGHFEGTLFGLSMLFLVDTEFSREDFVRATSRMQERIMGEQALQWVPFVPAEGRDAFEAEMRRLYPNRRLGLVEFDAGGQPRPASTRPYHYPILFIQPMENNERALGYDLTTAPSRETLERARETRQMMVTPQFRLIQEPADKFGVVMVWPIHRPLPGEVAGAGPRGGEFVGFLQCVFRVHDLLESVNVRMPENVVDVLYVDRSEPEVSKRTLYFRPAGAAGQGGTMTETAFRQGLSREFALPLGQRDWRVLYRPRPGWVESRRTILPYVRAGALAALTGLLAALIHVSRRRTEVIREEVVLRTSELAESRRHLASLLHALPGMAYRCAYDDQLTVLFLSEGARELTGWTPEEFVTGVVHFRDCIHPDDLNRVREMTRAALAEGADVEVEYRIRTKAGAERWVLSRGRGVYAEDGRLRVFEGLAIDITARKEAEAARLTLERRLLDGQKLESLGLLAGGIAHDFNNLLSSILGNANLVRRELTPGSSAEARLGNVEIASLRAAELCRQMLAYAGKGRFVIEAADLGALTEEMLPLLKISIARQAELTLNIQRNLPAVLIDATQIRQVVMNLVLNAADAIAARRASGGGEIAITTGVARVDGTLLSGCVAGADLPGGDYVFLEVKDDGIGMDPDVATKIFDPFYTTKFAGRGLGLAAVLGIVRGHHGALRVESTPGVGSSFRLFLPPTRKAPAARGEPESVSPRPSGVTGRVLVVDDEDVVRTVIVELLKSLGFAPTPVAGGAAALEVLRRDPAAFDLVVLDLLMPGMSGEETLKALRALNADVPVLIVSGYSEENVLGRLGGGPALSFLPKPFTRDVLKRRLDEILA